MKSIHSLLQTEMSTLAVTVANTIRDNMQKDAKERNEKNKAKMEANQNKNKATRRCWKCNVMGHIPANNVCKPKDIAAEDGERNQPHNPADISCAQPRERAQQTFQTTHMTQGHMAPGLDACSLPGGSH